MGIPTYVISGFLGSGKTTVLLRMMAHAKKLKLRPAIILNEIGAIHVEGNLFGDEKVLELLDGCICCTIREDLYASLQELAQSEDIDLLFIEGTGVANPVDIQEILAAPAIRELFHLQSVITILDASHYLEYQSIFSSSADVRKLLDDQIACASLLLLNKTDLVSASQLEKIKRKISKMDNGQKVMLECSFGEVAEEALFKERSVLIDLNEKVMDKRCRHDAATVQTLYLEDIPRVSRHAFDNWIKRLPNVLRGKGILSLDNSSALYSFQYASGRVTYQQFIDPPERNTGFVLIGIGMDVDEIRKQYSRFIQMSV